MALIEGLWTELQNTTAEQMFSADLLTPAPVIVYLQLTRARVPAAILAGCLYPMGIFFSYSEMWKSGEGK